MPIGAAIAGAAISGIFSSSQASSAQQFSGAQTKEQMEFQERMRDTAHQAEIKDLKAAGLNPILSGTGGPGAASPAGASASGSIGGFPNFSALALLDAQTAKLKAETENITTRTGIMGPVEDLMDSLGAITTPIAREFQMIINKMPNLMDAEKRNDFFDDIGDLLQNVPSDVTGRKDYNLIQEWWFKWRHRDLPSIHGE